MATFESFTHKGKDYKFRVGRETPKVKPLLDMGSDYYKNKQKSATWAMALVCVPVIVLAIIYFTYIGSDNPRAGLEWLAILAFPYGMMIYLIIEKINDATSVLTGLIEQSEDKEYLEAYKAWIKSKVVDIEIEPEIRSL